MAPHVDFKKKSVRTALIAVSAALLLAGIVIFLWNYYYVTRVSVSGNSHYSQEEIRDMVFENDYCYNSIILFFKYHNREIKDIPFIEQMDVEIVDPNYVRITVYEKTVAGYVEYLGHYMYFDKDGIVVESSGEIIDGVPKVTGLKFDHVVLHEQLPAKKKDVFMTILDITQLMNKYDIKTDRIAFDSDGDITLYFGEARVLIGSDDYIDEKINEMHLLLPKLTGYSGTLHMENYTGEESNFSFDVDKDEEAAEDEETIEGDEESAETNEESADAG